MTNKEKKDWLSVKYPLTVICDRYDGTYSGAKWLAFPLDYDKIPSDVDASDPECAQFWKNYKEPVGKGGCAEEAIDNLLLEMEPTESEDERIRKVIYKLILGMREEIFTAQDEIVTKEKALAYLEKKPDIKIWPHPIKDAYLERKEQKPAEYLDKDKVYAIMTKLTNLSQSQLIPTNSDEFKKLHEITSEVRDLLDYPIERKPVEWSEEEEKNLELVVDCIYEFYPDPVMKYKLKDWLKSLRPSWKPSEEQMKALQRASKNEYLSAEQFDILVSLHEDLNKL